MRQEHIVIFILVVINIVGKRRRWEGKKWGVSIYSRVLPHRISAIYRLQQTSPDCVESRYTMECMYQRPEVDRGARKKDENK